MAKNTRFMERLFSATEERDEQLTSQVAQDIEDAKANGEVDTEELNYKGNEDGSVSITDKENGEVTIAEPGEEGGYDLYPAEVSQQIEGYLHPEGDGVTPGQQVGAPDEYVENHEGLENGVAASNPEERSAEAEAQAGPEAVNEELVEEQVEFSVSTDNTVVLKIFSAQEFCERLFSEVIESEETAKVGSLKIEKIPNEDAVVVTDENSGDQAKVTLEESTMDVEELDSKAFCGCGCEGEECGVNEELELGGQQNLPLHVVGIDTFNHQLVDSTEYSVESAQELANQLAEAGVDGIQIFEDADSARDYAISLLQGLGVETFDQVEEPEQVEFSDFENVYVTRFFSEQNHNNYMLKLFSEGVNDIDASQSAIEDAIENGDEIETDTEVITPIDSVTAVVEDKDNGEYTKVVLDGDDMNLNPITEEEAEDLMENLAVSEEEINEDEEKEFSNIWTNEAEDRFFSENEVMTAYMQRLFSEEADKEEIESAIESGEQIENDSEVITPVDSETAVIEDKETGEWTLATLSEDDINLEAISEDEADELTDGLAVEEGDDEEDEKEFSNIWTNEEETRFFSENEVMTNYMQRLFSEEADQDEIESAIESGEQIENDSEVITPVDAQTAIIEDKETGEFTKATILDDEDMNVEAISEEEADELTDGLAVEGDEEDENQKHFSNNAMLTKFFNDMYAEQGIDPNAVPEEEKPSVEQVEDKAQAAIQAIQEMTQEAVQAIEEAKEAPVEGQEEDLREATFSESDNSVINTNNTALSWLESNMRK